MNPSAAPDPAGAGPEALALALALALQLREKAPEFLSLLPVLPTGSGHALQAARGPGHLADIVASLRDAEVADQQMLLETTSGGERRHQVLEMLSQRTALLRPMPQIGERTKAQTRG